MSRSYKKIPIIKDKPTEGKKQGNKSFRRKSKIKIKDERYDELPYDKSEVINDYDVSDYWFFANEVTEIKRKDKKLNK